MKTNSYFLFISVLSLVFGSLAFTSCNDDDDKDSKTSNLDGYWKITKSTRSNSSAETTFADDEGYITWYDESTNTETHYEYDYEGQLVYSGSVKYSKSGNNLSYTITDEETGKTVTNSLTIKELKGKTLVLYSDYSKETIYYKRVNKPELKTVSIKKENLFGKWQMIETWKPGDSSPKIIDPTEMRIIWTFEDEDMSQESTSLGWGPATMDMFKWNFDKNVITLFNYFDPNKFESNYEVLSFNWTYLKVREWTGQYNYKVMKFKSMAKG